MVSSKQPLNVISMFVLGCIIAAPMLVAAQITSVESTSVSQTATETAPVTTSSAVSMTVECWLENGSSSLSVATSAITDNGVSCYQVYSENGLISSIAVSTVPDFRPISMKTASTTSASATSSSDSSETSSSSNNLLHVLLPALLASLVGVLLLVLATVYFLRSRARRESQASRARHWADRNSSSWAMREGSYTKKEGEVA